MRDRIGRLLNRTLRRRPGAPPPVLPDEGLSGKALAVCHPSWRGVRTAAYAFGDPVVETEDAGAHARMILDAAVDAGVSTIVVHAFPSGADTLLTAAKGAGLATRAVIHSSTAQHGAERWEAATVDRYVAMAREGTLDAIGFVKAGMAEVFAGLGIDARYTPNRAPRVEPTDKIPLGEGLHVGVFASPFWRKNVVTQIAAVSLLDDATAHVMERPDVGYLETMPIVEHGELPWDRFVALQGSVDLNLYVTLSECHPLSPIESYLSGVPCLISRTSALFRDDPDLWDVVSVSQADDPVAIAEGARRLIDAGGAIVEAARAWIRRADAGAAARWADFVA